MTTDTCAECAHDAGSYGITHEHDAVVAPPIPLSSPSGVVYAYACPRCHQVPSVGQFMVPLVPGDERFVEAVESHRRQADRCCRCHDCDVPLGPQFSLYCKACAAKNEVERERRVSEATAAQEREDAAVEASLRHAMNHESAYRLRGYISDLSEECWAASWLSGCEFEFWRIVHEGPQALGLGDVSADDIDRLRHFSDRAGGWWRWNKDVGAALFVPIEQWKQLVAERSGT